MTKTLDPSRPFYLRRRREIAGLTQEQLAFQINTSKSMVSQMETGSVGYREYWVNLIAAALNIPIIALFQDPDADPEYDPELARIVSAWPAVPKSQRAALASLAETMATDEGASPETLTPVEQKSSK